MKRDWDVIREILIKLENSTKDEFSLSLDDFPEYDPFSISYNSELLIEAGLIDGEITKTIGVGVYDVILNRLTWNGHEFIDSIRNQTVWDKTKNSFISKGISMTFDVIKSVATDIAVSIVKSAITP